MPCLQKTQEKKTPPLLKAWKGDFLPAVWLTSSGNLRVAAAFSGLDVTRITRLLWDHLPPEACSFVQEYTAEVGRTAAGKVVQNLGIE